MNIEQVKETWAKHLEREDGMALVSVKDFKWLVSQVEKVEQLQSDIDFFKKKQEINKQIAQELVALNDSRVKKILMKTRQL